MADKVVVKIRYAGDQRLLEILGTRTVAELKQQIAAEHPTLPPPRLQKLICHGRTLQPQQLVEQLPGGGSGEVVVMLLQIRSGPGRVEVFRHAMGDALESVRELYGTVWRLLREGAWREVLIAFGRNLALFFRTMFIPPAPNSARRGQAGPAPPQ